VVDFKSLGKFQNHVNLIVPERDLLNILFFLKVDDFVTFPDVFDDVLNVLHLVHPGELVFLRVDHQVLAVERELRPQLIQPWRFVKNVTVKHCDATEVLLSFY
jgi:hypothetical protein